MLHAHRFRATPYYIVGYTPCRYYGTLTAIPADHTHQPATSQSSPVSEYWYTASRSTIANESWHTALRKLLQESDLGKEFIDILSEELSETNVMRTVDLFTRAFDCDHSAGLPCIDVESLKHRVATLYWAASSKAPRVLLTEIGLKCNSPFFAMPHVAPTWTVGDSCICVYYHVGPQIED